MSAFKRKDADGLSELRSFADNLSEATKVEEYKPKAEWPSAKAVTRADIASGVVDLERKLKAENAEDKAMVDWYEGRMSMRDEVIESISRILGEVQPRAEHYHVAKDGTATKLPDPNEGANLWSSSDSARSSQIRYPGEPVSLSDLDDDDRDQIDTSADRFRA